jgi:hypothetical protein
MLASVLKRKCGSTCACMAAMRASTTWRLSDSASAVSVACSGLRLGLDAALVGDLHHDGGQDPQQGQVGEEVADLDDADAGARGLGRGLFGFLARRLGLLPRLAGVLGGLADRLLGLRARPRARLRCRRPAEPIDRRSGAPSRRRRRSSRPGRRA